jgi:hypothetical protein
MSVNRFQRWVFLELFSNRSFNFRIESRWGYTGTTDKIK